MRLRTADSTRAQTVAGVGVGWTPARTQTDAPSKIEFVDVRPVHDQRWTKDHLASSHFNCAQAAGLDRCSVLLHSLACQLGSRVDGEVSEIARVPKHNGLNDAIMNVSLIDVREGKSDYPNIISAGLPYGFGGARHGGCGYAHDEPDLRVRLQNGLGFCKCFVAIVITGPDRREL